MRDAFWEKGQSGMLGDAVAGTLPAGLEDGSLTMLNAGIGLSIAQSLLSTINHLSPMSDVRRVVEKCVSLCKSNATPGFEGAAIESIGLVTRSALFSGDTRSDLMVPKVAQAISDAFGPEELGYFWHGVGRAHYFAPPNLIPVYGSIEHGFEMIKRLVKSANGDDDALQSALAGFWWAVTVVNMRNPQVLAGALKRLGTEATGNSGFTNGVMSTTIMRQDTTPDADFIDSFINYSPKDSALASIWKDAVADPARRAKDTIWPILKKRRELGQVFRFQNLAERAG